MVGASLVGTDGRVVRLLPLRRRRSAGVRRPVLPEGRTLSGTLLALPRLQSASSPGPLGGVVFGHFGDRLGRKQLLVLSLLMMGLATFAIGLLPTYAQIGARAPVLLTVLRLIQGFALGGEWGGAVLIVSEHGDRPGRVSGRRGRRLVRQRGNCSLTAYWRGWPRSRRTRLQCLGLAHPVPAVRSTGAGRVVGAAPDRGVACLPGGSGQAGAGGQVAVAGGHHAVPA